MSTKKVYAVIGIGIGPFNLGMAALIAPVKELPALFFDQADEFNWHPGLMFDHVTLQTPFLCDCVSMADPTSPYSFLNFLKETGRLYQFFIRENFFVLRKEYNRYCKWVVSKLPSCRFSQRVTGIAYRDGLYEVTVQHTRTGQAATFFAERIVLGTGTQPALPAFAAGGKFKKVIHTASYIPRRDEILAGGSVTVIGSGQSAAEVFYDLLQRRSPGFTISWFTRPDRFFPMEYSKLTLELTSPDFVDYFYHMPAAKRKDLLDIQKSQFKGINYDLINDIWDALYELSVDGEDTGVRIQPGVQLNNIREDNSGAYTLDLTEVQQQQHFSASTAFVVLGTGYKYQEPAFLQGIAARIARDADGKFEVRRNYAIDHEGREIFVQNAETHSHSLISTDLGMGAYRNSFIINEIAGREIYRTEQRIAFQDFGVQGRNTATRAGQLAALPA
ncbi:lysine N(6)-hydroxylase/L-ornithine N(5)-oxygenase family protein [Chitinophaga polysaccharea]|uniref:lysine N(6)-hydroxylase/L-ornithine N(5)-oxygenase family protein n=1 Tax=Chitinophaga polysaccharea TaxID=1293035 RepID=UPI00115A65EE|nr:SidA/IucD/PvdA family monooxygenase [Chitinophaga polysaccharea]